MKKKEFEEGHFAGQGLAIGVALGVALGSALGNVGLGIAMGVALGVALGAGMEEDAGKRGKVRRLSEKEKRRRRVLGWWSFVIGLLIVIGAMVLVGGVFR